MARLSKEADVARSRRSGIGSRWIACLGLALAATAPAVAQQDDGQKRVTTIDHAVELYLSDDAIEAQYIRHLDLGDLGPTEAKAGFFYNEDRDLIGIGDLLVNVGDDVGVRALEVRVGTRVYGAFLAPEDQDVFSISVGGEAQYFIDRARNEPNVRRARVRSVLLHDDVDLLCGHDQRHEHHGAAEQEHRLPSTRNASANV